MRARCFEGGHNRAEPLRDLNAEIARFHRMLEDVAKHLTAGTTLIDTTEERLLQGPFWRTLWHTQANSRCFAASLVHRWRPKASLTPLWTQ